MKSEPESARTRSTRHGSGQPGNQPPARLNMNRTYRSSPTRTTQIVRGRPREPSPWARGELQLGCGPDPGELVAGPCGHGELLREAVCCSGCLGSCSPRARRVTPSAAWALARTCSGAFCPVIPAATWLRARYPGQRPGDWHRLVHAADQPPSDAQGCAVDVGGLLAASHEMAAAISSGWARGPPWDRFVAGRGRPTRAAARRAGLEDVEQTLTAHQG